MYRRFGSFAFDIVPKKTADRITSLAQSRPAGPCIVLLAILVDLSIGVLVLGPYPRDMMFEYTSCMGPDLMSTFTLPLFLPNAVFLGVFLFFVVVGALHLIFIIIVIVLITNHNVKVGPMIGENHFSQRKQKNLMTFKQEMLVFALHFVAVVGYGLMINMSYEDVLRVMPIYRALLFLNELSLILIMCPELRFQIPFAKKLSDLGISFSV